VSIDLEDFLEGYYLVARRRGQLARYVRRHVRTALDEATTLAAGRALDEPAALFFALARRERAFPPDLWGAVVERFAIGRARALGVELPEDLDPLALVHLRLDARDGAVEYAGVRDWFAAHLVPVRRRPWPPEA
jgi:hypothetical protein